MNAHRAVWVVLPLALTAIGCDNPSSGANAAASASTSAPAASSAPVATVDPSAAAAAAASASAAAFTMKGASRRHVGLAGVLLRGAYDDSSLTDAQKATLDKLEDGLYADQASSPWAAHKTFQTDLVAFIRAAKVDNTKLQADFAAIDKAVQAGQGREADALNGLHEALDAAQRQALVDQVKAKRAAREAREKPPATAGDGGAPDWAKRRLSRLTAELALDDGQQKAVAALMAKDTTMTPASIQTRKEAAQKRVDALLTEFAKDTFDAKKLDTGMGTKTPHEPQERIATFTAGLIGILHPDQREKYAVRTERMGNRPGRNMDDVEGEIRFGADEEPMPLGPHLPR
jgi:Spy/CpxP family protein refolding chaperone